MVVATPRKMASADVVAAAPEAAAPVEASDAVWDPWEAGGKRLEYQTFSEGWLGGPLQQLVGDFLGTPNILGGGWLGVGTFFF